MAKRDGHIFARNLLEEHAPQWSGACAMPQPLDCILRLLQQRVSPCLLLCSKPPSRCVCQRKEQRTTHLFASCFRNGGNLTFIVLIAVEIRTNGAWRHYRAQEASGVCEGELVEVVACTTNDNEGSTQPGAPSGAGGAS